STRATRLASFATPEATPSEFPLLPPSPSIALLPPLPSVVPTRSAAWHRCKPMSRINQMFLGKPAEIHRECGDHKPHLSPCKPFRNDSCKARAFAVNPCAFMLF